MPIEIKHRNNHWDIEVTGNDGFGKLSLDVEGMKDLCKAVVLTSVYEYRYGYACAQNITEYLLTDLLEAVKELRAAQKDYMADRGNNQKGRVVAEKADKVDAIIAKIQKS